MSVIVIIAYNQASFHQLSHKKLLLVELLNNDLQSFRSNWTLRVIIENVIQENFIL